MTEKGTILFGKTLFRSTGTAETRWNGWVEQRNDKIYICTEFGQVGGKLRQSEREITETGNKASLLEKATHDIEKKWRDKQSKEGYNVYSSGSAAAAVAATQKQNVLPMLANSVVINPNQSVKNMALPCYVQPKVDGFRMVAHLGSDGTVDLMSRTNIPYIGFKTIRTALQNLGPQLVHEMYGRQGLYLDGELYIDGMDFGQLSGLIKRGQHHAEHDVAALQFIIFDCFDLAALETPFQDRTVFLDHFLKDGPPCLQQLPTKLVPNADHMREEMTRYLAAGYEGIMLRSIHGPYVLGKRSNHLLKHKLFLDAEYPIVGFKEGQGGDSGTVVWECQAGPHRFHVRPMGTHAERETLFQKASTYIGQYLTVKFQELSKDGVPRFPTGKGIRGPVDFTPSPAKKKKTK